MRKLDYQEVNDILTGCTILGTGGGGSLQSGIEAVEKEFKRGKEFRLLEFDEIEDDAWFANPYFCGSIMPEGQEMEITGEEIPAAVTALEEHMGVTFDGLVSIEYGGGNTGEAMAAAAHLGKYVVDADAAGRAVPELQFSTYYVMEQPITPFSVTTQYGDVVIVKQVENDARAEALSRFMAVGSDNLVGMADHPIRGRELKHSVVPSALTYAEKVGKARRRACEEGRDPVAAILDAAEGRLLFEGTVTDETAWEIKDGFTLGDIYLKGQGNFKNSMGRVWYKNENMVFWIDEEVKLTCPDLICIVEKKTGMPVTNPNCNEGMELCVLGFKCHELWRRDRGMDILNPRFFGFEMDCRFLDD